MSNLENLSIPQEAPKEKESSMRLKKITQALRAFALGGLLIGGGARATAEEHPEPRPEIKESQVLETVIQGHKSEGVRLKDEKGFFFTGDGLLDADEFKHAIMDVFPIAWLNGEVKSITQTKEVEGDIFAYMKYPKKPGEAVEIILEYRTIGLPRKEALKVLAHEIAHANDWRHSNSPHLTEADRSDLSARVLKRLDTSDRLVSSYVEKHQFSGNKEKIEKQRAIEYWAEIVAEFFLSPENLHIEDYELVAQYIQKTAPSFTINKAHK